MRKIKTAEEKLKQDCERMQRYYQKHKDMIKKKNLERIRKQRNALKEAKEWLSVDDILNKKAKICKPDSAIDIEKLPPNNSSSSSSKAYYERNKEIIRLKNLLRYYQKKKR